MATAQLGSLLQYVHKLTSGRGNLQRTDHQLLDAFSAGRDETAFAALVSRHGSMVLRVCQRVLKHEQDAEDAFQATFLILARKSATIRKRQGLGAWLHGVAYRTALEVKRSAARRRNHEARLWNVMRKAAVSPTWDDVQAILDEQIQRLPETYRAAFVLCVLEGKSGPQAAAELGVKEGAVWTRLTRARQLLQQRLSRRGIQLATVLAALAVMESASQASVSATLVQTTIRFGLLVAAGNPAADVIPSHIAALAAGVTRAMLVTKTKIAVAILLATIVSAACGLAYSSASSDEAKAAQQKPAEQAASAKDHAGKEDKEIAYSGLVLDPAGKPLAGAKLYLVKPWYVLKRPAPSPLYATTGADGRFSFTGPKVTIGDDPLELVATAKECGPGWVTVGPNGKQDNLTIQLVKDDAPISGQIVDLQGKPIQGVRVRVVGIHAAAKEDLGPWLKAIASSKGQSMQKEYQYLRSQLKCDGLPGRAHETRTDADGRFRLTGMGRDRLITVRIDGPTIASQELKVLTQPGKSIEVQEVEPNPEYGIGGLTVTYLPATFKHVAVPTKPITGIVRDKDTGSPLAGVTVKTYKLANNPIQGVELVETKTDAQGHYRLTGMPKGKGNQILFEPPEDQPYLTVHADVPDTDGLDPVTVDFEWKRAIWIEGQVTDKATGKAVGCHVQYFGLFENANNLREQRGYQGTVVNQNHFKPDGKFRVVGLPGPGILKVLAGEHEQYLTALERDDADGSKTTSLGTDPFHCSTYDANAIARIDPPQDATSFKRQVVLDPGETIKGQLVDPDGKPVQGAHSHGLTRNAGWEGPPLKTAEFTLSQYNPRRPRRVLFRHHERSLVGVLEPPKDANKPITVHMQPGATVTGRLVDADGQPRPNVEMDISGRDHKGDSLGFPLPNKVKTDSAGRFRVEGLFPGFHYELEVGRGFVRDMLQFGDGLRSGETKDLGDVQLKRPE